MSAAWIGEGDENVASQNDPHAAAIVVAHLELACLGIRLGIILFRLFVAAGAFVGLAILS